MIKRYFEKFILLKFSRTGLILNTNYPELTFLTLLIDVSVRFKYTPLYVQIEGECWHI